MNNSYHRLVLLLPLLLAGSLNTRAQEKYTIKGELTGLNKEIKIMLVYATPPHQTHVDSTITKNGKFEFTGTIAEPTKAILQYKPSDPDKGPITYEKMQARDDQKFYLSGGETTVTGPNLKTAAIKGGQAQVDYGILTSKLAPLDDTAALYRKALHEYSKAKDTNAAKLLYPKMSALRLEGNLVEEDFIRSNGNSYVTLDLLLDRAVISTLIDPVTFEPLYNSLSENLRGTAKGKKIAANLASAKKFALGAPVLNFTQNDTSGNPVSSASLKGKYVLIDFWASWCGPCRMENPNLLKAYNQFKDKNFEIVGVSLDDKKKPWVEAIQKDKTPWIHVSDLKGWENVVAMEYGITAVPQNFLIDPNGIIIAKNLRGDALSKKLTEIFTSKN